MKSLGERRHIRLDICSMLAHAEKLSASALLARRANSIQGAMSSLLHPGAHGTSHLIARLVRGWTP